MSGSKCVVCLLVDEKWSFLEYDEELTSLISDENTCVHEFNANLLLLIKRKLASLFEGETRASDWNTRDEAMKRLDRKIAEMCLKKFTQLLDVLVSFKVSQAESQIYGELDRYCVPDKAAQSVVVCSYLTPFQIADVHDVFKDVVEQHKIKCAELISKLAKQKATDIKIKRVAIKTFEVACKLVAKFVHPSDLAEAIGDLFNN